MNAVAQTKTMNDADLVATLNLALAIAIQHTSMMTKCLRADSHRRQQAERDLAAMKRALQGVTQYVDAKRPTSLELPVVPVSSEEIQAFVEEALKRRYCGRQLLSEHDFLAGACAAVIAMLGEHHDRPTDAAPADWRDVLMGGASRLQAISEGAD